MKVLICYENVPESVAFYVVDMTHEEFDHYSQAAGKYVNCDDPNKAMDDLMYALCNGEPTEFDIEGMNECGVSHDVWGKFAKCKLDVGDTDISGC